MNNKLNLSKKHIRLGIYILILAILLLISIKVIYNFEAILLIMHNIVSNFFSIIAPISFGFLLAYILFRPTIFIQKKIEATYKAIVKKDISINGNKLLRVLSIALLFLVIGTLFSLIINFVIPPIVDNLTILINNIPKYEDQLVLWIEQILTYLNKSNIPVPSSEELSAFFSGALSNLANSSLLFFTTLLNDVIAFVINFIFTLIFAFYFIKDKEVLFDNFRKFRNVLLPKKTAKILTVFLHDLDEVVGKFLIGQVISTVVVGFVSAALMLLIKHPFAILIGTVAGITNIIPLVGPVIGAIFAFFLGIFSSVKLGVLGAVLLILYQQIDGNFVQPKIVGDRIGLIPIWILILVLIGGSYFGAIGMILSMPLAGLFKVYFNRYAEYKKLKETNSIKEFTTG